GSCKGDIEEDPDEEERVQADRDERHVEEPGAIHRIEPGPLKDPESRNENEAAGRDDREPEESKVATDELEARAHQPCAVDDAADQPGFHRRRDRFDDYEIVHVSPPPRSPASSPSFCSRAVAICSCISSS